MCRSKLNLLQFGLPFYRFFGRCGESRVSYGYRFTFIRFCQGDKRTGLSGGSILPKGLVRTVIRSEFERSQIRPETVVDIRGQLEKATRSPLKSGYAGINAWTPAL